MIIDQALEEYSKFDKTGRRAKMHDLLNCEHEEPPLNPVDETHTHKVACWYAQKHYEYDNKG